MSKSKFTMLDSLSLQDFDENSELIPLMTTEDEEAIKNESLTRNSADSFAQKHCFVSRSSHSNYCWARQVNPAN